MKPDDKQTFSYAIVEDALALVFRAKGKGLLALRGRLKTFQRAGLTPESPGRGKVIRYSIENVYDWGLALALADFGLTPEPIVSFVKKGYFANHYAPNIDAMKDDSLFFCLRPFVLKSVDKTPFPFVMMKGSDICAAEITAMGGRIALIDLSWLKRALDAAIVEALGN